MTGSKFRLQEGNFFMSEKNPTPNTKPTHAGCFELLKQIMEMITEQTVFLKKKTTLKDIITAALLGQTKGSPGLVFCIIRGSLGKARNNTSTYGMLPVLCPNFPTVFSSRDILNLLSLLCV